jgi:hypothetical protein
MIALPVLSDGLFDRDETDIHVMRAGYTARSANGTVAGARCKTSSGSDWKTFIDPS